jgi:dihydroneopterin aldolase
MAATTLYLLRHGDVDGRGVVYYGHRDVPLSVLGRAQAEVAARRLWDVRLAAVHASDLSRAADFANTISQARGVQVEVHAALREMAVGVLEGVSFEEARARYPDLAARSIRSMIDFAMPGGGESLRDVAARVVPAVNVLWQRHRGETFALVGHQNVNQIVISSALGLPLEAMFSFKQSCGALSVLRWGREGPVLLALNETLGEGAESGDERIRVVGVELEGRHGWHAEERLVTRRFRVDLEAVADLSAPSRSDKLRDTIDYRALAACAVRVGTETSHRLIESLAGAIGDALLEGEPRLRSARVTVYKQPPGLAGNPVEVAVTVSRVRGER